MTISPKDLTAEERAIVDHRAFLYHSDWSPEARYKAALNYCEPMILHRRALFTSESEKPAQAEVDTFSYQCPSAGCKEPASSTFAHYDNGHHRDMSEKPALRTCPSCPDTFDCTPAPVAAVRMTEELRMVLLCAEMNAAKDAKCGATESARVTRAAIAAVRAQAAAQPGKP